MWPFVKLFTFRLDPRYIKAYYRRASANYALGKLKAALKDFKNVLTIVPKDPDAAAKAKLCEKILREDAFQKAIEMDAPVESTIDIDSIIVEETYRGPRMEKDAPVTLDFVQDCIELFRAEKLLHRKYVMIILLRAIEMFKNLPSLLNIPLPRDGSGSISKFFLFCYFIVRKLLFCAFLFVSDLILISLCPIKHRWYIDCMWRHARSILRFGKHLRTWRLPHRAERVLV